MHRPNTNVAAAINVIVCFVALCGNITTIIAIAMYRDLQSTTNFYILNLAIADLLVCVSTTPSRLVFLFNGSLLACRITIFWWLFFFNASVFAILFISIDRYIFICKPLYYRTHCISTKIKYWISISWIVAFLFAVLPFTNLPHLSAQHLVNHQHVCVYKVLLGDWYLLFLVILTEILPPFCFCLLYSKIIRVARKHAIEIAIQFSKSRPLPMDWLERRRFTESLVSPFENPTYLLDTPAGSEGDELSKLRTILYRNHDSWKQKWKEEVRQRKIEVASVNGNDKNSAKNEELSQVGRSLREWRRRAVGGIDDRSLMETWEEQDKRVIGAESRRKRFSRNRVGPTESGGETSKRARRTTTSEQTIMGPRPKLRRLFSLEVVASTGERSATKRDKKRSRDTIKDLDGKRPNFIQTLPKLSALARRKKKQGSGKLKIYKEFKAVKMLGIVVGMFALLHLPIAILELISLFSKETGPPFWIVAVALYLTQSSPAVNPLIYVFTKREFRYAFVRLWSCGRFKKRSCSC